METKKNKATDDGRIPLTLENVHEVTANIPSDKWEKNRKFLKRKMAESHKFWEEREKESRKSEDTSD